MNSFRLLADAHSYATFANAEKYITKEIARFGEMYNEYPGVSTMVRYVIIAQEDGRFTPAVHSTSSEQFSFFLHNTKAAVLG